VDEHYYRLVPFSDEQITEFRRFYDLIERFDDQLAEHDAQHALADPQWPAITAAAGHTLSVLECGDHGLRHQVFDPYHLHPPTDTQSRILRFLLEDDFPGAAELREQAGTVSAREVAGDGVIELSVGDAPPARVDFDVPVEAHYYDMAEARHIGLVMPGPLITVQLFVSRAGFMSRLVTTYTVPKELFTRIPEIQEYEREVRVWVLLPEDPR
ncbi:MAG TPA: hypothetical protein VHS78_01800, partial [Candidatus Elarobacter sp.]|nr:hypothetical protein [Candidatus Elarobacter sp.]